ncbi:MAG: GSCFA domain-containing protein [Bacteroidota bacterium]
MSEFRTPIFPKRSENLINHQSKVLLIGSCFTENIGNKMKNLSFDCFQNPFGIVYNPQSICDQIIQLIYNISIEEHELFFQNEQWHNYHFHSRFSRTDKTETQKAMNESMAEGHLFLKDAEYLIITLGTAKIYELNGTEGAVANCHKTPNSQFTQKMLSVEKIFELFNLTFCHLLKFNPSIKIIFTTSPIRHWKDGATENLLSKSTLNVATYQIIDKYNQAEYFPAYEIMMDDLRDYRFYKDDMLHPSEQAIDYIWEKFCSTYMSEETLKLSEQIFNLINAKNHRPFNEKSEAHLKFKNQNYIRAKELKTHYPYLKIDVLINYFSQLDN